MKVDLSAMTATIKSGTFPVHYGPDGILRWTVRPTPGSVPPTEDEVKAEVSRLMKVSTDLLKGAK